MNYEQLKKLQINDTVKNIHDGQLGKVIAISFNEKDSILTSEIHTDNDMVSIFPDELEVVNTFASFFKEIIAEAESEGPEAVAQLKKLVEHFRIESKKLNKRLKK